MAGGFDFGVAEVFIIVKGFIDAKDEHGRTIYGTFLGVVSRRNTRYISVMFSREEVPRTIGWRDLLAIHDEKDKNIARDSLIAYYEHEMGKYLENGMILNNIAKNRNAKYTEQSISRYCLENLQFKAVCFIDFVDAGEDDLKPFIKKSDEKKRQPVKKERELPNIEAEREKEPPPKAPKKESAVSDVFIKCDPVLDPVNGVAVNELREGNNILGRLPADSIFYKVLAKNMPSFDGAVIAKVTGVLTANDLGTTTVSLELSDGVSGIMKLSGKVKVKLAEMGKPLSDYEIGTWNLPPELIFIGAGFLLFIAAMLLIYYLFY
ncbi:MAG: hypothetical protein LBI74_10260 [Synergistaceae bacterium]|jgi:hypothetical protein|nr:hypothetical protein [Synergistaceae bacterium]